jgi:hypothetical protein
LAAIGAGLLKSEEILEGVARLRMSNDIEYEEETFLDMMKLAREVHIHAYMTHPLSQLLQFQCHTGKCQSIHH